MSYDFPKKETYFFPSAAFGATTESRAIKGPKGMKGLVRDIRQYISADMVGTTTVPEINVGSAASDAGAVLAEYARFRLGSTAILGYTAAGFPVVRARALCLAGANAPGGIPLVLSDFTSHIKLETLAIPADTVVYISRIKGAGGSPAGTGVTEVEIDWF